MEPMTAIFVSPQDIANLDSADPNVIKRAIANLRDALKVTTDGEEKTFMHLEERGLTKAGKSTSISICTVPVIKVVAGCHGSSGEDHHTRELASKIKEEIQFFSPIYRNSRMERDRKIDVSSCVYCG